VDDLALRERLGSTAKFPRWATAFRLRAAGAHQVLRIRVNVGRTGAVTPCAELEPVLAGTVSMATLHNAEASRGGRPRGDRRARKGGDVIEGRRPILSLRPDAPSPG
jgi:DNA ligase (NAD+)